jgi:hypothetical protein
MGLVGGRMARACALVLGCLALAHCSGPDRTAKYSAKVVDDGEPVPKGGGNYTTPSIRYAGSSEGK